MPGAIVATPRGTTKVVTRGNPDPDPIQTRPMTRPDPAMTRRLTGGQPPLTGGPTVVNGGTRWRLDQSERDTWHWHMSVRGVRVSVRGQACMDPCQSLAIMRRLVECKKSIIPLDPAISLDEDLKGRNYPSHLEAINEARISYIWC
ncbi:hypothetical protein Tco_0916119 [Tanacetum coccineum]